MLNRSLEKELIEASRNGHTKMVRELLAGGAKINHADENGDTALIWAAYNGHTDTVHELLASEAAINHPNKWDRTALTWAAINRHTEIVKIISEELAEQKAYAKKRGEIESTFTFFSKKGMNMPTVLIDIVADYARPAGIAIPTRKSKP
jgi:ankyrin repeat protein